MRRRSLRARSADLAAVLTLVLGTAAPAAAKPGNAKPDVAPAPATPDPRQEAKKLSATGQAHFDLGEYDAAIADFKEAYRIFPTPGLLYNLGQAHRLKGDCGGALTMYRNYLRLDPATPHREVVEKHLADMEACERARKEAEVPATLPPPDAPPALTPKFPPPPVRDRRGGGGGLRVAGLVTAGAGVAALAAGGYFAYDAEDAEDEVQARSKRGEPWSEYRDVDERGKRSELLGAILLSTGGAALAAGATAYYLGWREGRPVPSISVAPGARATHVVLTWGF